MSKDWIITQVRWWRRHREDGNNDIIKWTIHGYSTDKQWTVKTTIQKTTLFNELAKCHSHSTTDYDGVLGKTLSYYNTYTERSAISVISPIETYAIKVEFNWYKEEDVVISAETEEVRISDLRLKQFGLNAHLSLPTPTYMQWMGMMTTVI